VTCSKYNKFAINHNNHLLQKIIAPPFYLFLGDAEMKRRNVEFVCGDGFFRGDFLLLRNTPTRATIGSNTKRE
jgi:hypothetical protein